MQEHNKQPTGTRGKRAEQIAEQFLRQNGLTFRARNYRCKAGEVDLVMDDGNALVFVEVRLRGNRHFGQAAESVTWRKQQKVIKASQHYLLRHKLMDKKSCRFDIVALTSLDNIDDIQWLQNAFAAFKRRRKPIKAPNSDMNESLKRLNR